MNPRLRFVNFGAGVQSTALLGMIMKGILPKPDHLIFSDTQWEPPDVYEHLGWCEARAEELGIGFHKVTMGDLRRESLETKPGANHFAKMPLFMLNQDGSRGMGRRQCTKEYKITPINRKMRELLGYKPRQRIPVGSCEAWFGISYDELVRMRTPDEKWKTHFYPLVDMGWTRTKCIEFMKEMGIPHPARSACVGCPFHSDREWRAIKEKPDLWDDAVDFDEAIRHASGIKHQQFLHKSCVPLKDVDLSTPEDHGQLNLFLNECEGGCGI